MTAFTEKCLRRSPRDTTTVFSFPASAPPPFGEDWAGVTEPWRTIGGHEVRRLSSGTLAGISSRVVGGIVCEACNTVLLVVGSDPQAVSALLDSAAVAKK